MPWTRRQVRYLESNDSPLTASQKSKMNSELHNDPAMGHMKKGFHKKEHMSKVDSYKKSKRKAHRVTVEPADDGSGYITTTHYPMGESGNDALKSGRPIDNEGPEKGIHKNLSSVHRHMNDCMGGGMGKWE